MHITNSYLIISCGPSWLLFFVNYSLSFCRWYHTFQDHPLHFLKFIFLNTIWTLLRWCWSTWTLLHGMERKDWLGSLWKFWSAPALKIWLSVVSSIHPSITLIDTALNDGDSLPHQNSTQDFRPQVAASAPFAVHFFHRCSSGQMDSSTLCSGHFLIFWVILCR